MGESSNTPEASAVSKTPEPTRVKPHKRAHRPRKVHKPFKETLTGKTLKGVAVGAWEGTKLGARGAAFVGKEGAKKGYEGAQIGVGLVSEVAKQGWKYRHDLMVGAVGSALTIIAQNPGESRDVSLQAYEQVVNQAGRVVRDLGGDQPSKVALDAFSGAEKSNPLLDSVVDTHYRGMVGEEREQLKHQIELMGIYMSDIITAEGFENVAEHMPAIEASCAKYGVEPEVVAGVAFAETAGGVLGDLEHKTEAGALGPYGHTDGFAEGRYGKRGLQITNMADDPRLNWDIATDVTCEAIGDYQAYFGDTSLATAAYHRGQAAVEEDIRFWAEANGKEITGSIRDFVEGNSVNDWRLRQNRELREAWETDEADMTNIYPTRVAGSHFLKLNVEAMAAKQLADASVSIGE